MNPHINCRPGTASRPNVVSLVSFSQLIITRPVVTAGPGTSPSSPRSDRVKSRPAPAERCKTRRTSSLRPPAAAGAGVAGVAAAGRPVEGVLSRGEGRDYHSFLCSSMETPPGPMETSISRPPTTDSVWTGDIHQVRKTNTNNRTNSAALRKDIRPTILSNNSVAGQNQSGNRPTMSFRRWNKDLSYTWD